MPLTLDLKEGIILSDEEKDRCLNELGRVRDLAIGMHFLYRGVCDSEMKYRTIMGGDTTEGFGIGNIPGLREAGVNLSLLSCMFDWYAINACRLFSTIGYIARYLGKTGFAAPRSIQSYSKRVCGPVQVYRNKIAAHYAFVDPRKEDNPADLALSKLPSIGFLNGRVSTGVLIFAMGDSSGSSTSQHKYQWSVTRFHEDEVQARLG